MNSYKSFHLRLHPTDQRNILVGHFQRKWKKNFCHARFIKVITKTISIYLSFSNVFIYTCKNLSLFVCFDRRIYIKIRKWLNIMMQGMDDDKSFIDKLKNLILLTMLKKYIWQSNWRINQREQYCFGNRNQKCYCVYFDQSYSFVLAQYFSIFSFFSVWIFFGSKWLFVAARQSPQRLQIIWAAIKAVRVRPSVRRQRPFPPPSLNL